MSTGLVSSEVSLPWLGNGHLLHISYHHRPSFCALISSCKDTSHTGLGVTHMISFCLSYLFKGPISNTATLWVLGVRMQHEFGEEVVVANSVHNTNTIKKNLFIYGCTGSLLLHTQAFSSCSEQQLLSRRMPFSLQ